MVMSDVYVVVCSFRSDAGLFQLVASPGRLQIVKVLYDGSSLVLIEVDVSDPSRKHSRLFTCQWDEIVKMVCQLRFGAGLG